MTTQEPDYKGKKALVADDDPDFLDQVRLALESLNFEVLAAESQTQAEMIMEQVTPDLAVFDLMMENQDSGFVLSYKAKKLQPQMPVILITGVTAETGLHFDASTEETQVWIRADVVLDKPVRLEQLQKEIDQLMEKVQ